ncbi:MAG: addiction module toxin RelE [Gammaproteobacteria bacterium]|nr:addiction module toxin RelE [Gammaproteobacteria bacterium]|tara:strand:- start:128280 stop:128579 length:300 start_codon:yes stop_codon:yes gene_type:complete
MKIISKRTLREFYEEPEHADSKSGLESWYAIVNKANWKTPHEVKNTFKNASIVGNKKVVFNIAGNKYRLIVSFNYDYQIGYIKFIGTHEEYDKLNIEEL